MRDRGDGVKQVTIPAESNIKAGEYVKITKLEIDEKYSEDVIEEALNRLQQVIAGETELHDLDEILEDNTEAENQE